MIHVRKGEQLFPFSEGIMAKSLTGSGLSVEEAYEIVRKIRGQLWAEEMKEVSSDDLKQRISEELQRRGRESAERFYRLRRHIKYLEAPLFILIGGTAGVGKSTISADLGHRFGIQRVIGSDTIREIMRSIISPALLPTLHESSFNAYTKLKTPFVTDKLVYAFEQQVSFVCEGIASVMRRGRKEGLNMVLNGVHVVPGFIESALAENVPYLFEYVLTVPEREQHRLHFYTREEGAQREPDRYIEQMENIRRLQDYIVERAEQNGTPVIENTSFEDTMKVIVDDVISTLEGQEEDGQ